MRPRVTLITGAMVASSLLLSLSVLLLQGHFQALKEVKEFSLPLAAEIPTLQRRADLLKEQVELSELQATLRSSSLEEKLRMYVLPKEEDPKRILAFLESTRTYLEQRKLLQSMSPVEIGDRVESEGRFSREIRFSVTVKPEGRALLLRILHESGLLTVGDALSPENIKTLFGLTETQGAASIVPVEKFLSADLLSYVQNPLLYEERLAQGLSSEELLVTFRNLLKASDLPAIKDLLTGDFGRALTAQQLWPMQFMEIAKQSVTELPDGWEKVDLTLNAYSG